MAHGEEKSYWSQRAQEELALQLQRSGDLAELPKDHQPWMQRATDYSQGQTKGSLGEVSWRELVVNAIMQCWGSR